MVCDGHSHRLITPEVHPRWIPGWSPHCACSQTNIQPHCPRLW